MSHAGGVFGAVAASTVDDLVAGTQDIDGWDIGLAVAAVVSGWILGRLAQRAVRRVLTNVQGISEDMRQLAARVAKYLILLMAIGVALGFLGASVQPILAASLIIVAIAVLALRGIADNFAAGVVIQTRRPIQLGDEIEVVDHVGVVKGINGRSVILQTTNGATVHVPNSTVLANPLINNSAVTHRRSEIEVRTAWTDDVDHLLDVIASALRGLTDVRAEPVPTIRAIGADPSRITLRVRVWHEPTASSLATSAGVIAISKSLRAEHIDAAVITPPPDAPLTPPPTI